MTLHSKLLVSLIIFNLVNIIIEKFVSIKSSDTDAVLKFSRLRHDYFYVSFKSSSLCASKRVWLYSNLDSEYSDCDSIVDLFSKLASRTKGWDESEKWISIEGDFKIELISNNLGHVKIEIELSNYRNSESWEIYVELRTELGQIEQILKQVKNFFS